MIFSETPYKSMNPPKVQHAFEARTPQKYSHEFETPQKYQEPPKSTKKYCGTPQKYSFLKQNR